MISWLPPGEPNGEILGYSLYMKTMEKGRQFTQDFSLGPHINYYTMSGLHQVQSKGSLGAIHELRQHNFGLGPTHYYASINNVLNVSKTGHFIDQPTQFFFLT